MDKVPKSLRHHIGLFGRTNTGKSSLLNVVAGQDVAITSATPGTTTDVVEKVMELLPIGPVVFLDTAGVDDTSELGHKRIIRTQRAMDRADVAVIVTEAPCWGDAEEEIAREAAQRGIPCMVVVNKADLFPPDADFLTRIRSQVPLVMTADCANESAAQKVVSDFRALLSAAVSNRERGGPRTLLGDLVPEGGIVVLVVPIDLQAPKGRLILPQVQAIRDALDHDTAVVVVKERELGIMLSALKQPPALVVCDSQVVQKMVADTPDGVKCTTFSILFARLKGDLVEEVRGAAAIDGLREGDRVLVAEACTHHPLQDDIGRVKIPRWLRQFVGEDITIDTCAGRDYPESLSDYKLVIHCGACMLTRQEMLVRLAKAAVARVPLTNYGLAIAHVQGVLRRVLSPFPGALTYYDSTRRTQRGLIRKEDKS